MGYQTLGDFMRTQEDITPRDLLEICHSISANLKEFHEMGFALGTIGFDNIFVTKEPILVALPPPAPNDATYDTNDDDSQMKQDQLPDNEEQQKEEIEDYRFETYIPGIGFAYKVPKDEDVDDYAVNMEEFGMVVKRMLQHYHARQMQRQSSNSVLNNNQHQMNDQDHNESVNSSEKSPDEDVQKE